MAQTDTQIRSTLDRVKQTFTARPGSARGTYHARAEAGPGLSATASEGNWKFDVGMPEAMGGTGGAPTPGVFGRAAFLSCLVISLRMEAISAGLAHARVGVDMEYEMDSCGMFGIGEVTPGFEAIRLTVEVESDAPEGDLRAWLDRTMALSPWMDVFRRPQPVSVELRVVPPGVG
jgi:uncharacterized OsmC-like protein